MKFSTVFGSSLFLVTAAIQCGSSGLALGWTTAPTPTTEHPHGCRRAFVRQCATAAARVPPLLLLVMTQRRQQAMAEDGSSSVTKSFSDADLKEIVKSDLLEKQFLVTGDLTRDIYQPTATFTDEIDTYGMDQWMKGTKRLFVGSKSDVRLVGDVEVTKDKVEFRFDEDLMFNIPFKPVVSLTGRLVLERDASSGLISSYREYWDQDVATVLKSAKF